MLMREMRDVLRQLENNSSTTAKMAILRLALADPRFKMMVRYALDPYKTYGVTVIPSVTPVGTSTTFLALIECLDKAASRALTGTALRLRITELMTGLAPSGIEVFRRMLLKDLRCGVGSSLINKVEPGTIPEFGIMLATPLEPQHIAKIKRAGAWHQAKKNGDRMVAMIPARNGPEKGDCVALSRKGHALLNYTAILRSLSFVLDQSPQFRDGMVFDGEVIVGDFFKTRETKKLAGNETEGAVYHIFDMIPMRQWITQNTSTYGSRYKALQGLANTPAFEHFQNLSLVPAISIDPDTFSVEEADKIRDSYIAERQEGLIIRLDEPYNFKTRSSLFKHKRRDNADCLILEVLEGEKAFEGTAGAMMIELPDGETRQKCGIQATRAERDQIWEERNQYAGKWCEVSFQDWTQPKSGSPRLQFPVFKRLREDKS